MGDTLYVGKLTSQESGSRSARVLKDSSLDEKKITKVLSLIGQGKLKYLDAGSDYPEWAICTDVGSAKQILNVFFHHGTRLSSVTWREAGRQGRVRSAAQILLSGSFALLVIAPRHPVPADTVRASVPIAGP